MGNSCMNFRMVIFGVPCGSLPFYVLRICMEYFHLMHVLWICMNIFILANIFVYCSNNLHFYVFLIFLFFIGRDFNPCLSQIDIG
jgi:hypothetical protein